MSTISLFVTGAPLASQAALSALRFCQTSEKEGVRITQVFFYSEAASIANRLVDPMDDELNLSDAWRMFAARTATRLVVCIASSERRGVFADPVSGLSNLADGFEIAGLGQFHSAMLGADRLAVFR